MRFILCVTSYLLLDGWTDLHETLGLYTTSTQAIAWSTFPLPDPFLEGKWQNAKSNAVWMILFRNI